jgi:hypothetical protein
MSRVALQARLEDLCLAWKRNVTTGAVGLTVAVEVA